MTRGFDGMHLGEADEVAAAERRGGHTPTSLYEALFEGHEAEVRSLASRLRNMPGAATCDEAAGVLERLLEQTEVAAFDRATERAMVEMQAENAAARALATPEQGERFALAQGFHEARRELQEAKAELQTIAERVGPAIGEGQIATQSRKPGDVARAVRTLVEQYLPTTGKPPKSWLHPTHEK